MRMWMIDTKLLCNKHLLGEHVECHMLTGHLKRKRRIDKYIDNNLLEPLSIKQRHDALAKEMIARQFKHNSPLRKPNISYLPVNQQKYRVNTITAHTDLKKRCTLCRQRAQSCD